MASARPGDETTAVIAAAIRAAEEAGLLPCGGIYGQIVLPDPVGGACCDGAAAMGPQYCTCWEPVFDLEQQPVAEGEPGQRAALCRDCAYRPGSPERQGDKRYSGDPELLEQIIRTGARFFCHAGIRQVAKLVHPSGAVVDALEAAPGGYQPPVVNGVPHKADGSPGDVCAGWAARRAAHLRREERTP